MLKQKNNKTFAKTPPAEMPVESDSVNNKPKPERPVTVRALVTGEISQLYVCEGDMVKKGALIAEIDPASWQGEVRHCSQQLIRYQANLNDAKSLLETLYRQYCCAISLGLSNIEIGMAHKTYLGAFKRMQHWETKVSEMQTELSYAEHNLKHCDVVAIQSGYISNVCVQKGQFVEAGDNLAVIAKSGN